MWNKRGSRGGPEFRTPPPPLRFVKGGVLWRGLIGRRGGPTVVFTLLSFFRAQEPKAPVTYCDHALSGVRPSVVRRPLDYLHFRLLLQNRLMDFDETWYGWSTQGPLQVLLFFGQICPGADPGRGKNRSGGSPSSGNFFFRPEGYSNKPNA